MIRIWRFILVVILSALLIIIPQSHSSLLETVDKQLILTIHNRIRGQVASGANGLSLVSNMRALDWNVELENKSIHFQSRCLRKRKSFNEIILSDGIPYLIFKYKILENTKLFNISNLLQSVFTRLNVTSNKKCKGQIKCRIRNQILEPQMSSLGCTLDQCTPTNIVLTCAYNKEYLRTGHSDSRNIGRPCSNCLSETSYCLNGSLCAAEPQCNRNHETQCQCLVTKDACIINGVFVENRCQCICKTGFEGVNCQVISKQCLDKLWRCPGWAKDGFCLMKTIRNICEKSCTGCKSESLLNDNYVSSKTTQKKCLDKRSECRMWKDKHYCNIKTVQLHCPHSCSLCKDPRLSDQAISITSKPSMSSSLASFISLSGFNTEPISCKSSRDLCSNPKFRAICKRTCERMTSQVLERSSSSVYPISPKIPKHPDLMTQSSIEPPSCLHMRHLCTNPTVQLICKNICSLSTSLLSKTKSPTSSTSSMISVEPVNCPLMKDICSNPNVRILCKRTCDTITSPGSSTLWTSISSLSSTISTVEFTEEPTTCPTIKSLCHQPEIRKICKKTCDKATSPVSSIPSTVGPSKTHSELSSPTSSTGLRNHVPSSTTYFPEEPYICKNIKENCTILAVRLLCKNTCGLFTSFTQGPSRFQTSETLLRSNTLSSSVEPPICPQVKNQCANQRIKELCIKTCSATTSPSYESVTTSIRLSSAKFYPTTPITTELSICPNMKHLCGEGNFKMLCRKTCAATTVPPTSSESSSISGLSKPLSSEPEICRNLVQYCLDLNVKKLCSLTCSSSTTSQKPSGSVDANDFGSRTTCKPTTGLTESPRCIQMSTFCNVPGLRELCPITCDECARKTLSRTEVPTTQIITTEFSGCPNLIKHCINPEVALLCPTICGH